MSCDKKDGKRGKRGHKGPIGFPGDTGPTGPCCTGPTGASPNIVPSFFPILKALAATFFGNTPAPEGGVGLGDIFDFPLDGANDPIGRENAGTFLLPFPGLYKITWQIPINEPSLAQVALGANVQSTLTTQTVAEGSFDAVTSAGKGSAFSQLVGETFIQAVRNNQPIRIENTGTLPVTYFSPIPENPNQRTINIASVVPQRLDSSGGLFNDVPEVVAINSDVTFSRPLAPPPGATGPNGGINGATFVNLGVTPASPPYTGIVIQRPGRYIVEWGLNRFFSGIEAFAFPYVNGAPMSVLGGVGASKDGTVQSSTILNVGDVVTLRNVGSQPITLDNQFPNAYLGIYSGPLL